MALVNLKMSKKDMAEEASPSYSQSPYPSGCCLYLDTDELEKLGIKSLPSVGDEYHIVAVGEVTSVSENDSANGGENRSLGIQIQMMELTHESESEGKEKKESAKSEKGETVLSNAYRGRK